MIVSSFDGPLGQRFGWALIHFIWQGTLVALGLKLGLRAWRRRPARWRYGAACAAMLCLVAAPLATFVLLTGSEPTSGVPEQAQPAQVASAKGSTKPGPSGAKSMYYLFLGQRSAGWSWALWVDQHMDFLLLAWAAGVALTSTRLGLGWWQVRRWLARSETLSPHWQELLHRAASRLRLTRAVRLLGCARIESPATVGWLRPVVLIPIGCLTGLTPGQWEAILAHEVAHIRRHDYLVNMLQRVVEAILFYHPAVWWVSDQVRLEREQCCDDTVVEAYGDALNYAHALVGLERLRPMPGVWALAASDGSLLPRIRRLAGRPADASVVWPWLLIAAVAVIVAVRGMKHANAGPGQPPDAAPRPALVRKTDSDQAEPQVLIEVKFVELGADGIETTGLGPLLKSLSQASPIYVTNRSGTLQGTLVKPPSQGGTLPNDLLFEHPALKGFESVTRGEMATISEEGFRGLLHDLESKTKVKVLAAPRVTTLSGRQARIQVVEVKSIVTGVTTTATNNEGPSANYTTTAIPIGPSVDLVPHVSADRNMIRLTVIPALSEFLGYDDPGPAQVASADGREKLQVVVPMPRFQGSQTVVDANVPRGHTLLIRYLKPAEGKQPKADSAKQILIFVTPAVVDATGRTIHAK